MKWALIIGMAFVAWGCGSMPRVRLGKMEATAPKDTGKPAEVVNNTTTTEVPIPEGTTIESLPPGEITAAPFRLTFKHDTLMRVVENHQAATTGTVDTSVALRRVDNAARMPLLYAAIGAAVGAAGFLFLKYPTPALLCGAASVVFFIAWQAAGLPAWFWVVGAVALAGGVALWLGHERGEHSRTEPKPTP